MCNQIADNIDLRVFQPWIQWQANNLFGRRTGGLPEPPAEAGPEAPVVRRRRGLRDLEPVLLGLAFAGTSVGLSQ